MLEESQLEIILLKDLDSRSKDELLQIGNLGANSLKEIFECLAKFDQIDRLKAERAIAGQP